MPGPDDLPADFADRIRAVHGADGAAWVTDLPAVERSWRTRWGLGPLRRLPLSFSYVAAGERSDGTACVLKLVPPAAGHLRDEAAWLRAAAGPGVVALLEDAAGEGALLLERLAPGDPCSALVPDRDAEATDVLADALAAGARPAGDAPLPTLADRLLGLDAHLRGPERAVLPHAVVAEARRTADRLLTHAGPDALLHGDLHHDNVLRDAKRGWVVIDPHGLRGDPDADVGAIAYNPPGLGAAVGPLLDARLDRLAVRLDRDRARLAGWCLVQAVLSSVWDLQGGARPGDGALEVVRRLARG